MASVDIAERILQFVQAKGYKPQQIEQIAEALGIGEQEHGDFHDACRALMRSGRVVLGGSNALSLPPPPARLTGSFRANPRGFGFVIPEIPNSHGDLYVPAEATGGAMTGDRVLASVKKLGKRGGAMLYEGRVLTVLERGQSRFVGELRNDFGKWFVVPDGRTIHGPIIVADPGAKNAKAGDQVVVEITQYPTERAEARGAVVKVLGERGLPDVDTQSIIEQYQLPGEFSDDVLSTARAIVAAYEPERQAADRLDLSEQTIITIDPVDARDFDDAISVTQLPGGAVELGVHIADVAHFVQDGSVIDAEARDRANSVYLPRTVLPMLPEVLSNGICSLQEREPRLTKSVFINYDRAGNVRAARFANAIIRNTKRLTYEQASSILNGKAGRTSAKVVHLLQEMERLARAIQARRKRQGMLSMEFPEAELVFDDSGRAVDVKLADTSYSHTIIEMFMVEANEAVARLFHNENVPALRRIHDEPSDLADGSLQRFVRALGHDLPAKPDRQALQSLLQRVHGKPESFAINLAVLRSMAQAEYSPMKLGHYALASEHYCHFTSPIRRYPDLVVHRLLELHLRGELRRAKASGDIPDFEELGRLGEHCSGNERRAEAAERELNLVLILRMLENRVGEVLRGVVTGVANVGVFVQLEKYLVEGLLRFDALPDDWWQVDTQAGAIVGERSGRRIRIGDALDVVISRISIPSRRLDLGLEKIAQQDGHVGRAGKSRPTRGDDRSRGASPRNAKRKRPRLEGGRSRRRR